MLKVPNIGKAAMLELIVRSGLTIHLFANKHMPGEKDAAGAYREPQGGGYAPKKLSQKSWTVKGDVAIHPDVAFTFSGATSPDVIYGYVVKFGNIPMWAENLPEPFPVAVKGDTLAITPTFALSGM